MADYSDSDDEIVYSTTSVLLGYAEDPDQETSEDTISHLGGIPSWFDESSPADSRLAKCLSCHKIMPLLLQLDGNLPQSPHHRRLLYIFGCRSKTCRRKPGSIRAVRGVQLVGEAPVIATATPATPATAATATAEGKTQDETNKQAGPGVTQAQNMGNMIFGAPKNDGAASENRNPFATGTSSSTNNPFATSSSSTNPFMPKKEPASDDRNLASLSKTFAAAATIAPESSSKNDEKKATAVTGKSASATGAEFYGPPSPWPDSSTIPSFPSLFLDASYEELDPESDALTKQAQELAKISKIEVDEDEDMDDAPAGSSGSRKKGSSSSSSSKGKGGKKGGDGLEDSESPTQKAFNHFTYMVSQNPEQVLRYERNGAPLLYSNTDEVGKLLIPAAGGTPSCAKVPRCKNCGEKRVFEVQLMPHTISALEDAGKVDVLEEGMEWGTVIVATCGKDCTLPGAAKVGAYAEEWAGVQWEELMKR